MQNFLMLSAIALGLTGCSTDTKDTNVATRDSAQNGAAVHRSAVNSAVINEDVLKSPDAPIKA